MGNKKKGFIVAGIAALTVIAAVLIGIIAYNNSTPVKLGKQLELGQKYLTEQDYEQAIVAYQAAIEINPMASDAYLGLADAYIGKGEYEKAAEVLQTGYDTTADERLEEKLEEVNAEIERIKAEEEAARLAAEQAAAEAKIQAVLKTLYELMEAGDDQACAEYMAEHIWGQELGHKSYSPTGDDLNGIVLDILGDNVFFGEKIDGKYESTGKYFMQFNIDNPEEHLEYMVYDGQWKNDKPNGAGTLTKVVGCSFSDGDTGNEGEGINKTVYTATFVDGYAVGEVLEVVYEDIYEEVPWIKSDYFETIYFVENGQIDYSDAVRRRYFKDGTVQESGVVGSGEGPYVSSHHRVDDAYVYHWWE